MRSLAFRLCLALPLATGCAGGRLQLSAADNASSDSKSDSGGSSDGSKSDGSSDGSGDSSNDSGDSSKDSGDSSKDSGKSKSDDSSKGSSESRSETSNTVTTKGNGPESTNSAGLLLLSGAILLGATTVGVYFLLKNDEPALYVTKHEREIRLALARGEGPFVRDVGSRLAIERAQLPRLASVLRGGRARLEQDLGTGELTPEQGARFVTSLAEILREDAVFGPYVERLMVRVQAMKSRPADG